MAAEGPAAHTRSRKTTTPTQKAKSNQSKPVDVDLTILSSPPSSPPLSKPRKRRLSAKKQPNEGTYGGGSPEQSTPKKRKTVTPKTASKSQEKRLRLFRKYPPQSYQSKLERAVSQRMFVVNRIRTNTAAVPSETVEMAGTTGNIYTITIDLEPRCTCPDNRKGNQCKHIVYVLHNVLKAPEHLQYQLALLSSELREIFAGAPTPVASADKGGGEEEGSSNRKEVAGDCPICFMEFEPEREDIVWCKAACGNNIHKDCFEQWAKSQGVANVKCVYCRTPWQGDEDSIAKIKMQGKKNKEGYINVASQLGLSGRRDTSTYHSIWLNGQQRMGYDVGGYDDDDNYDGNYGDN